MSDLLNRLKAGRAATRYVSLGGIRFALRCLTEQDYLDAGLATHAAMLERNLALDVMTADLFEDEKSSQLLVRALVDPDSGQAVASSAAELRAALTRAERTYLVGEYLEHEQQYSPTPSTLGEEEFIELLEAVKKTPEKALSSVSSFATLKRLITTLVSPLPS